MFTPNCPADESLDNLATFDLDKMNMEPIITKNATKLQNFGNRDHDLLQAPKKRNVERVDDPPCKKSANSTPTAKPPDTYL